jgi:hypothetical protein
MTPGVSGREVKIFNRYLVDHMIIISCDALLVVQVVALPGVAQGCPPGTFKEILPTMAKPPCMMKTNAPQLINHALLTPYTSSDNFVLSASSRVMLLHTAPANSELMSNMEKTKSYCSWLQPPVEISADIMCVPC